MSNLILRPASFNELAQFANMAAKSAMVPPSFRGKPEDIMLAVQMGSEVGLSPMQALQNIAVINNRPSLWGDAMLGLCRNSPRCEDVAERMEGEGDALTAFCVVKRKGATPVVARFSVADAKKAGLWGKQGPWQQYPARMLQMRARGFALRDAFPDVLRGLISAEEAADTPTDTSVSAPYTGTTIDVQPEPVAEPADPAADWANARIADLNAADTYEAVQALVGHAKLAEGLAKMQTARPDLYEAVEAAKQRAMDRILPPMKKTEEPASDGGMPE